MQIVTRLACLALLPGFACAGCSKSGGAQSAAPAGAPKSLAVAAPAPAPAGAAAAKLSWPRTFQDAGATIAVHQPQIVSWEGDLLVAKAAVSATPAGGGETRYGTVEVEARTDVDKPARVVELRDIRVTKASFPQAQSSAPMYLEAVRRHVDATRVVPLDHLEANFAAAEAAKAAAVEVKNDPPQIIVATTPTLLVLIDGEPVLREVKDAAGGAKLKRVVNTRPLIVLDESGNRYYLHAMRSWFSAAAPTGPWSPEPKPPEAVARLKESLKDDPSVDLLEPTDPKAAPKQAPAVVTSTRPAELIQTEGEPTYERVPGTNLMFVSNTDAALFKDGATQEHYVLVSGRWFSAGALAGPWAYVPGKLLPQDFAKIPTDGPKANVLVSVPGTPQAREAAIANSIPQTAAVKISEAKLTVTYDGAPRFAAISGAKGLSYALNTSLPVIRIDADSSCWCVQNGVWFKSASPTGPWAVATEVPGIIYTIPPSSPVHYVTYVRIYGTGPDVVYVGYTPGYMGTYVTSDGVVVYGTGYVYPAYVGTVYVGYPPSYGYGASFAVGAASGFAFGFVAGASMGCWSSPYWGPYHGHYYGHIDINSSNVYTNWRGGVTTTNRHYEYDPWENKAKSKGSFSSFNPYSGRSTVGGYKGSYDYDNNEYSYKRGAATYDPNSGTARAAGSKVTGDADEGTQTVKRGAAEYNENTGVVKGGGSKTFVDADKGKIEHETGQFRYNTNTDTGIARKGDDVYVGKDDNVYRHTDEGWQKKTNDGWEDAQRDPNQTRQLDQQRQSRQTGEQRVNNYERAGAYQSSGTSRSASTSRGGGSYSGGSTSRGGYSGGGRSGGGASRGGGGRGGGRR